MTTLETLKAARELISDSAKWTTRAYARDAQGRELDGGCHPDAVCWCAQGAVRKAYGRDEDCIPPMQALRDVVNDFTFTHFNDTHTHAEVLALFDKAIASLETKEAA